MAKFHGPIGFAETVEVEPGIYEEQTTERTYYGDLIRNFSNLQSSDSVNDNIRFTNKISIVADLFAEKNFFNIRYATFMGAKWKVVDVDASQRPRLILTTGGVYNGQ